MSRKPDRKPDRKLLVQSSRVPFVQSRNVPSLVVILQQINPSILAHTEPHGSVSSEALLSGKGTGRLCGIPIHSVRRPVNFERNGYQSTTLFDAL